MSRYSVFITPEALAEARGTPGNVRQRVRRAITGLGADPRPAGSSWLEVPAATGEVRRLRIDAWRVVYVVSEADRAIDVVAVRRRPPYDYGDLAQLVHGERP